MYRPMQQSHHNTRKRFSGFTKRGLTAEDGKPLQFKPTTANRPGTLFSRVYRCGAGVRSGTCSGTPPTGRNEITGTGNSLGIEGYSCAPEGCALCGTREGPKFARNGGEGYLPVRAIKRGGEGGRAFRTAKTGKRQSKNERIQSL